MSTFRCSRNRKVGWVYWFIQIFLSILFFAFTIPVYAQEVGKTARIVNTVHGNHNNIARKLTNNDPVFSSEKINAKLNSHGEIRLNDNSRIIVGPGSEISLDDFVVSGGGIVSGTLNVAKGAFRFLSGNSRKGTFSVKTPLTTIGIRGTIFDVYVKNGGVTDVILFSGEVEVCTSDNICRIVTERCDIVQVLSATNIISKNFLRSGRIEEENDKYNLISNQFRFPFGWWAPIGSCTHRALLESEDTPDVEPDPKSTPKPTPKSTPEPEPEPEYE